jgi:hypothetical protein
VFTKKLLVCLVLVGLAIAAAFDAGLTLASSRNPSGQFALEKGCSYLIFTDGTTYYAQNCSTGAIDYGGLNNAGGDTGTNATQVIQSAINTIVTSSAGKLLFGPGTFIVSGRHLIQYDRSYYICSVLTLGTSGTSNVQLSIAGQGIGVTTIKLANSQNCNIAYFEGYKSLTLKDLTLDGNNANNTYSVDGAALLLTGGAASATTTRTYLTVDSVAFQNSFASGIYLGYNGYPTSGYDKYASIANSRFINGTGTDAAIHADDTYQSSLSNLLIANYPIGIMLAGPTVGFLAEFSASGITEIDVQQNVIKYAADASFSDIRMDYNTIQATGGLEGAAFYIANSSNITLSNPVVAEGDVQGAYNQYGIDIQQSTVFVNNPNIAAERLAIESDNNSVVNVNGGSLDTTGPGTTITAFAYTGNLTLEGTTLSSSNYCFSAGSADDYLRLLGVFLNGCPNVYMPTGKVSWTAVTSDPTTKKLSNQGTATISSSTSVSVTHRLFGTPTLVLITPENTGYGTYEVTAIGPTTFTITVQTPGTYSFYWYAEYRP